MSLSDKWDRWGVASVVVAPSPARRLGRGFRDLGLDPVRGLEDLFDAVRSDLVHDDAAGLPTCPIPMLVTFVASTSLHSIEAEIRFVVDVDHKAPSVRGVLDQVLAWADSADALEERARYPSEAHRHISLRVLRAALDGARLNDVGYEIEPTAERVDG